MSADVKKEIEVESPGASVKETGEGKTSLPGSLPVLPLGDMVIFPGMMAPLVVSTDRSKRVIDDVASGTRHMLAVLQKNKSLADDEVTPQDMHGYGCLIRLVKMLKFPDNTLRILVQGVARCKLTGYELGGKYLTAYYQVLPEETDVSLETTALTRNAAQRFQEIIELSKNIPDELAIAIANITDPVKLTDLIGSNMNMPLDERQALVQENKVSARLTLLATSLNRELQVLKLGTEIQTKVNETFSKNQREIFLREQLRAIQSELGEDDPHQAEFKTLDEKIVAAKMPAEIRKVADKERKRLQTIPQASPEFAVTRNYLDWLVELPWAVETEDKLDIAEAQKLLNEDHYDLEKIKERMLEYLSVLKLKKDLKGAILCLVGPPGVGKTSLGRSIARAMGRKFVRISLGGVHDEAEIRGHRRTYIGSLPGRIIQGIRRAGTRNPVFMLDEIDKLGSDFRGDPSSALLEVLDPEQNSTFSDHFLEVPFDLSRVMFITTANQLDTIPPPLRDRMEILQLSGYTLNEKVQIAEKHLIGKQIKEHGLKPDQITFTTEGVERLIADYTREAGVRNLEREIANICRKTARRVAEGKRGKNVITPQAVRKLLGARKFELEVAEKYLEPGVVTGLAWTPSGGDILFIEASKMPGKGNLTLTGSLGDVMKESAQTAMSYVRANAEEWGIKADFIEKADIHIHVPAGAIPKDGPSAGVAMVVALLSLFSKQPLRADVALTGEISLRGKIMPVGGIKEKVLAAARAGIRRVILPVKNKIDLDEIPAEIREKMDIRTVATLEAAFKLALHETPNGGPA